MATYRKEIPVRDPEKIPAAYREYYARLARHFKAEIEREDFNTILEVGCGNGQLTLPLLRILPGKVRMFAADSFKKPYSGWLQELEEQVREAGLETRVRFVEADATKLDDLRNNSVDVLVSNELLCDLVPRVKLRNAVLEFRRVLKPHGIMVHGEWSSTHPRNSGHFKAKHSPSWNPDELQSLMWTEGFGDFRVTYFDTTIKFTKTAALEELSSWGASPRFLRKHENALRKSGVKLPFEHVISSRKAQAVRS